LAPRFLVAGSLVLDLMAYVERLPKPGEVVHATRLLRSLGGKGFNQAVALRRLGAEVAMAGAVGEDSFGDAFLAGLGELDIERSRVLRLPQPTGLAMPVVDRTGENLIVAAPGANLAVPPELAEGLDWRRMSALLLQGELAPDANLAFARAAAAAEVPVLLNAAPASAPLEQVVGLAATVVVNEGEAEAMGGAESLLALGARSVVVTLGAAGASLHGVAAGRVPAPAVQVADTTGAGDAFAAALALALAEGREPLEAAAWAAAAGAAACTREGTSTAMPSRAEVERLFDRS
jgi:ribokinase